MLPLRGVEDDAIFLSSYRCRYDQQERRAVAPRCARQTVRSQRGDIGYHGAGERIAEHNAKAHRISVSVRHDIPQIPIQNPAQPNHRRSTRTRYVITPLLAPAAPPFAADTLRCRCSPTYARRTAAAAMVALAKIRRRAT